jgi:hypothetical protein
MDHKIKTAMGALFLFLFVFTGCSRADLALRYADQFMAWELKDQFGFNGSQKQKIDELSKQTLVYLKRDFLPELISELKSVKSDFLAKDWRQISPEEGARFLNEKRLKFKSLGQKSLKIIAQKSPEFAALTNEKNWKTFVKSFNEKNREILKSKPKSRFPELVDRFLGDLSKEQEELIKAHESDLKPDPALRIKNRETTLSRFNELLTPYSSEAFSQALFDFFTHTEKWNDNLALQAQEIRHEKQMQILAQVLKLISSKQKKILIEEWDDLIQDLENGAK